MIKEVIVDRNGKVLKRFDIQGAAVGVSARDGIECFVSIVLDTVYVHVYSNRKDLVIERNPTSQGLITIRGEISSDYIYKKTA